MSFWFNVIDVADSITVSYYLLDGQKQNSSMKYLFKNNHKQHIKALYILPHPSLY